MLAVRPRRRHSNDPKRKAKDTHTRLRQEIGELDRTRQVFEAFCLEVYDKVERRIKISPTVFEAVATAFENAKDLPEEVSSVTTRDIAGARYVPPSDAPIMERVRIAA